MEKLYSVVEVSNAVGLSTKWIQKLGDELIKAGHGQKVGKVLVFRKTAITYIKKRSKGPGRPKLKK